jgi:cell division protein FtsL
MKSICIIKTAVPVMTTAKQRRSIGSDRYERVLSEEQGAFYDKINH